MTLRNVLVMLVLAVLAVLGWFYVQSGAGSKATLPATLPTFVKDEVTKATVTVDGQTVVLHRRTDRTDAWEVDDGAASLRADAHAVDDLLSELKRQEVRDRVPIATLGARDVADWGLTDSNTTLEIVTPGGTSLVRYGNRTREGTSVRADTGPGTDVWILGGDVIEQMTNLVACGARSRRLTDLYVYDVGRVEIVQGGVTVLEAARDASQVWRVSQPYKGYAEPSAFEQFLSKLVNCEVTWVKAGEVDLKKWGLDAPRAEVRLTEKHEGKASSVILVGASDDPKGEKPEEKRGVYVMEQGRNNVALAPIRFLDAAQTPPASLRDDSFTRLGIDGTALKVKLGNLAYDLRKEGASWDILAPDRYPADDAAVRALLEKVRSWRTVAFLDHEKPEDWGIVEGCDQIGIELQGGGKTTLLFGRPGDDGNRYAQRRDADGDGGVELVEGTVLDELAKGYGQFRRKRVRDFATWLGDLTRISRDEGRTDEGEQIQTVVIEREGDQAWKLSEKLGPGVTGTIDPAAVARLIGALTQIVAKDWMFWDTSKNEEMGFLTNKDLAVTCALGLDFSAKTGAPDGGAHQRLLIGKRREGGGYYARFVNDPGWAFILSDEDVQSLSVPLTKQAPKSGDGGDAKPPK